MYSVYLDKNLIHDLDSEDNVLVNPTLNLELNKAGTFEFSMECTHPFYDKLERFKSIIQVLCDGDEIFKGRIIEITDDMYKERTVYCESELAYLNDTIQRPYEYHLAASAVYEYLQAVIGSHNSQVGDYDDYKNSPESVPKWLELGMVTVNDPNDYIYCYTNYNSTMDEIKEDLVDDLGGYIRIRNEYKNNDPLGTLTGRYIDYIYLEEYGKTGEQRIEFGENLLDFSNDINQADICTGIIPLGATLEESQYAAIEERVTIESVNSGSDYLVISDAVAKYGLILKVVTWDDITEPKNLKTAAENYLAEYDYEPQTITATAVDMHLTDEEIESWRLGDKIFVESDPHDLHKRFPLAQMSIPLDQPENTSVTLGTYEDTSLSGRNNKTETGLRNFENFEIGNVIASAVARATAIIDQHTNGYVTIHYDEKRGCADEILIMDAPDIEDATRVWRWNLNGLGYSSNGYHGDYGLAITMDGWILGTFIIANGMILADDNDVEFAKFNDKGMEIYAQSGRSDLLLMSIGREGLTLYDDTGTNILATFTSTGVKVYNNGVVSSSLFANGMTFYNSSGEQVILRLFQQGLMVNNSSGSTLMTLTPQGLRVYDSGEALRASLDSDSLDIYDSNQNPLMRLNTSGAQYYYNNNLVGTIGTSYWIGHTNNRGLVFNLENGSAYMAFGWKESSSATTYTAVIAYHTPSSSEAQGVHFGDNLLLNNYKQYFGTATSGAYLQADVNGGLIIDGGTLYIQQAGYYQGDEIAGQQWVLDQLSSGSGGGYVTQDTLTQDLSGYVQKSDTATITIKTSSASANGNFSFQSGGEIDISDLVGGGSGGFVTNNEDSATWQTDMGDKMSLDKYGLNYGDYPVAYFNGSAGWGLGNVNVGSDWNYGGKTVGVGTDITGYTSDSVTISAKDYIDIFAKTIYFNGNVIHDSDERLKTSIQPINDARVDNITPVTFKWRDGDNTAHYGYIAQEVQPYFPELVSEGTDGMLGLAYTEIIPLLHAKINTLEDRIAKLEAIIYGKEKID